MSETNFSKRMRDNLQVFKFDFYRVESHSTQPGIPDVHWLFFGGTAGWVETKFAKTMPKKVTYRPYQAPWLTAYARHGGNACTLLHVAAGDEIVFIPGQESMLAAVDLSRCLGRRNLYLKSPDAWKRVAKLILGGAAGF